MFLLLSIAFALTNQREEKLIENTITSYTYLIGKSKRQKKQYILNQDIGIIKMKLIK